jgi:hypothetical protein
MIADEVSMNQETFHLILTEELGMRKICSKMVPRKLTEQKRDAQLCSFWYPNALKWCCSLLTHLISHLVTSFYFKELKQHWKDTILSQQKTCSGLNAGLKQQCVPGMLHKMAAPLEKVCAGTRDVLWRWPHCSWQINKIIFFWNQSHYFIVRPYMIQCTL